MLSVFFEKESILFWNAYAVCLGVSVLFLGCILKRKVKRLSGQMFEGVQKEITPFEHTSSSDIYPYLFMLW